MKTHSGKKIFLQFSFFLLTTNSVFAQMTSWVNPFISNSTIVNAIDVEVDNSGNSYVTGNFTGTVNFNYNGTATNIASVGGHDIFIAKNDAAGALLWVKTIGGTLDDLPVAIDIASSSVVIAGTFRSANMDFDPGAGSVPLSSSGGTDLFVLKLDGNGAYQWAKRAGGTSDEFMTDVELQSTGEIYLAGSFITLMDFFSSTNTSTHGGRDAFLCKLDASGVYQWVKTVGGAGTDVANKLTVVGPNALLSADIGSTSTTFDFGSGTNTGTFSGTGTNGITSHFSQTGVYQASYHFTGNTSVIKMVSTGSTHIIVGTFTGTMDVNPGAATNTVTATGTRDMFIVGVSALGGGNYSNHFIANGQSGSQVLVSNMFHQMGANSSILDLYVVGHAMGSIDLGGSSTVDVSGPNTVNEYAYFVKYHFETGNFANMIYAHETVPVVVNTDHSKNNGVAVKSNGDILLCGYWSSTTINSAFFHPNGSISYQPSSTYAMGFLQYLNGCSIPNTVASAANYSICNGSSAALTASGATTYSWNTGSTAASINVSPTVTTTYTVTGTVTGGCSKTDTVKITIKPSPNTVAGSNKYSICNGTSSTITASGATTYSWNTGSTALSLVVSPTTTSTYTLTGTTNGCSKTDTVKITVKPIPNVIAYAGGAGYSICNGTSVNIYAYGATSYVWNTGSTAVFLAVSPTTTTTYSLTGTTNGCSKSDTVKITVKPLPSTVASVNDYSVCNGSSATLSANGAVTYSWNTGSTATSINITPTTTITYTLTGTTNGCSKTDTVKVTVSPLPSVTVSPTNPSICLGSGGSVTLTASGAGTYAWSGGPATANYTVSPTTTTTYTVTGTSAQGCAKTATVTVSVTSSPVITITPPLPAVCSGTGVLLTASGVNTYTWTAGPSTATYSVNPSVATTYTVTGTATGGCTGTATVTVNVSTIPTITITATSNSICEGGSTTLNASGANTYSWDIGETTAAVAVSPLTNTTYTMIGTSTQGCTGTANISITVNSPPVVTASASDTVICSGNNTILNGIGANTYSWNTGATGSAISVSPATNTSYTLTGTSTVGCTATSTIDIIVNQSPDNTVTTNIDTLTAVESNASYQWIDCNTNLDIPGETNQSFIATVSGSYAVIVSNGNCTDTSGCVQVTLATGVDNPSNTSNNFLVYPNPATESIMVSNTLNQSMHVQLLDYTGKLIIEEHSSETNFKINVGQLSNGLYYIKIIADNIPSSQKIMVSK